MPMLQFDGCAKNIFKLPCATKEPSMIVDSPNMLTGSLLNIYIVLCVGRSKAAALVGTVYPIQNSGKPYWFVLVLYAHEKAQGTVSNIKGIYRHSTAYYRIQHSLACYNYYIQVTEDD